jgi:PAS domain S-box-containing protein
MRLQSKFVLTLLPLVVVPLLLLGIWSADKTSELIHYNADSYLTHTLHTFVSQELERRHLLLKKNQLDKVPSFVQLYQKEVESVAENFTMAWPGHIFAFSPDGKLIFDSQKSEAAEMESRWAPQIARLAKANGTDIQGHNNRELFTAIQFKPWKWLVFLAFDGQQVHQATQRIQIVTLVIAMASALLMALVLTLLFRRNVTRHISILRLAAEDVAAQKYPEAVEVNTRDELGSLARDMENMSRQIKQSQQKILQFSNELESMVEQRTQSLERTQTKLTRAQQIAGLGSWDLHLESGKLNWSDETFRIFGLEPGEIEPTQKKFMEFVHPEDREAVINAVETSLKEFKTYSIEHRIIRPDGSIRLVRELGDFSYESQDKAEQLIGTVHDITEHRMAENERISREKLQGAIETAGAVCHELNQPLQVVMGHMEFCYMKEEYTSILPHLDTIRQELQRMAQITAKLQNITQYKTRDYLEDVKILDLDKASK